MATVIRQRHSQPADADGRLLAAWLHPRLERAGKLYTMERKREPELMDDDAQALAYAQADFEDPHSDYINHFRARFGDVEPGVYVLDLGCGPGDISFRFARAFPGCLVHGVDGSVAMLRHGRRLLGDEPSLAGCVQLIEGFFPGAVLPREAYDVIISNSLLHHLRDPRVMWSEVARLAAPGAPVFIMDLRRPDSPAVARKLVDRYTGKEPEILRRDFYNSLLAAFKVEEIRKQLDRAGLGDFEVEELGDRHVIISGMAP